METKTKTKTVIVTMFFNLKKLKDASVQTRPQEFYIENGRETLKLQYPMVIFCDESTYDFLKNSIRSAARGNVSVNSIKLENK